eukprot:2845858-Amphidinium_carterae.2
MPKAPSSAPAGRAIEVKPKVASRSATSVGTFSLEYNASRSLSRASRGEAANMVDIGPSANNPDLNLKKHPGPGPTKGEPRGRPPPVQAVAKLPDQPAHWSRRKPRPETRDKERAKPSITRKGNHMHAVVN